MADVTYLLDMEGEGGLSFHQIHQADNNNASPPSNSPPHQQQ